MRRRPGFTLIELLVATVLSVVLTAGVLMVAASLARDSRWLRDRGNHASFDGAMAMIRHDLGNAMSLETDVESHWVEIVGHGAIDPATLRPSGRLCRVRYLCRNEQREALLVRTQYLLDDAGAPEPWSSTVCSGVSQVSIKPLAVDAVDTMPTWVEIRLVGDHGQARESELLR